MIDTNQKKLSKVKKNRCIFAFIQSVKMKLFEPMMDDKDQTQTSMYRYIS